MEAASGPAQQCGFSFTNKWTKLFTEMTKEKRSGFQKNYSVIIKVNSRLEEGTIFRLLVPREKAGIVFIGRFNERQICPGIFYVVKK